MSKVALIVINFGGPRNLEEVPQFLEALLTDKDVIRTPFPAFLQDFFFKRVARKRSLKVARDYEKIGGKSPIFEDTEYLAEKIGKSMNLEAFCFHRYLNKTHPFFFQNLEKSDADEFWVFPLFPQFSYATTGSIARWFKDHLPVSLFNKMKWISSYESDEKFIESSVLNIKEFIEKKGFEEKDIAFVFSAHGLPESFILEGDPYQKQCQNSFEKISARFPQAFSLLSYQSKFGRAKWITPSTIDCCNRVNEWIGDKKHIVFVPLSFTSDHIETLFEIEEEYVAPLRDLGFSAHRCPALGRREDWLQSIESILIHSEKVNGASLIRSK